MQARKQVAQSLVQLWRRFLSRSMWSGRGSCVATADRATTTDGLVTQRGMVLGRAGGAPAVEVQQGRVLMRMQNTQSMQNTSGTCIEQV